MPTVTSYLTRKEYEKFKDHLEKSGLDSYHYIRKLILEDIYTQPKK